MNINIKNRYALLGRDEEAKVKSIEQAEAELNELVRSVVVSYDGIKGKHPDIGIGDTATDEAIAHQIYHAIHFREIPLPR